MHTHSRFLSLTLAAVVLAACGTSELVISEPLGDQSFVRVARTEQGLTADAGSDGITTANNENFYLAINKSQLSQKWFMSAYLTQWHPAEAMHAARSLGTRVVQFKIQNDKLYVFDATNGSKWSDTLDPQLVVEAYPIITTYAPFNAQSGSQNFVLIDPSAGLNRFEMMGDSFAASYSVRFEVELSFLQRFRALADGVSYEQVFTGYSEAPGAGILSYDQPFRGSGTMAISLRRYSESAGFVASESATDFYFKSSNVQQVPNEARFKQNVVKWNIKPGMQPVQWRISQAVDRLKADPRLAGIDVEGAIARGITGWNDAFGFPVFTVVPTTAADSFGDDDKNFVVVDTNPGLGLAFANWRENPNTGEIRGASVYFSSVFLEAALQSAGPDVDAGAPVVDAGAPVVDAGAPAVDAGAPVVDAGLPAVDGGSADAGGLPFQTCGPSVVISQVFGGNSTTGIFNQDFIELHNRSNAPFALSGYSVQYSSANGTTWQVIPLTGSIAAGGFYLVGLATASSTDAGTGTPIPTPNVSSSINISGTAGKVAFVLGTAPLTGACPTANVGDLLGYGATNCSETRPAPATSSSTSVFRSGDACVDTNDNGADFVLTTDAPSNSSTPPVQCGCNQSGVFPGLPLVPGVDSPFGMTVQSNFAAPARPRLRFGWAAMPDQHLCEMEAPKAVIPAGMTRKEFIEKYITETILHEVGHTLGLRHNFKGSLSVSSVMDYNAEADAIRLDKPGAYDVAAVKYLYGLSPDAPTQAFCTDESTVVDAQCDRFDQGANPLTTDVAVRWKAAMTRQLKGERDLTFGDVFAVTRYVRGPVNEAQRLEAFNALIGDVAPPLRPDVTALGPNAAAYANYFNAVLLLNLFTEPASVRDEIQVNPSVQDAAFRARAVQVAKDSLLGSDGNRSWETMRVMVNVLKEMQHGDAMIALTQARAYFATNRNAYPVASQPYVDDMIRRIDAATTPYFR